MRKWLFIPAILVGWGITWLDSGLSWDDTGITAGLIVISTGILGFFGQKRPWLWALAVGIWIPLVGVFIRHDFGGVLALVVAFIGAYTGMYIRRISQNQAASGE